MLRRNALAMSNSPLGTESTQQELANSIYPDLDLDELLVTEHPAFSDLRRANEPLPEAVDGEDPPRPYDPVLVRDRDILGEFIEQTLKMRRGMQAYEFSIVRHDLVNWNRRPTPKEIMGKTFEEIGIALATLFWTTDNAVGVRISLRDGIEVGVYTGNPNDVTYDPYLKFLYNVTP